MREMTGVWNLGILLRSSRKRLELSSAILSTGGSGPSSAPGELSCSALSPEGRRGANWERPLSGKLQPRVGCLPRSPPPPGSCEGPERKRARREISPSLCNFPSLHATWCYKSLRLLWKERAACTRDRAQSASTFPSPGRQWWWCNPPSGDTVSHFSTDFNPHRTPAE